ncbi:MAG: O-antigen ligase family protein [Myxococcales bacterium]|nr:O-antigen ligase family protein [Myxococcota bacterium]MDW8282429.1 O-antigen ligase family protein [Myxococcales bacterium]
MFSLPGLCSLLFFLYLRPQEAIAALRSLPMLNLCAALAALGLMLDLRLGLARVRFVPALGWALAMVAWGLLATLVKVGPGAASQAFTRLMIPLVVLLLVGHGVTTFRGLQVLLGTVLALGLAISAVGIHQAAQPFGCFQVQNAWADRDMATGRYDGRPCEKHQDCRGPDAEPGYDYLCEKPGLLGTASIGGGRVRYRGILQDPNELALTIGIVVPFAIGFWQRRRNGPRALLLLGTLVAVALCTIFTRSRGGQLVFLTVLGAYFIRRFGLALGAVGGALAAIPVLLLGGRSGEEATASALERTEALYAGLQMVRSSPILGVGISHFADNHYITAHNSFMLAAAEMGLPGYFLWTSMLYVSVKTLLVGLRRYASRPEAAVAHTWAMTLLASYSGLLVGIFFLSFSYHVVLFVYLGLSGAYYQACCRHDPSFQVRYSLPEAVLVLLGNGAILALIYIYTRLKGV